MLFLYIWLIIFRNPYKTIVIDFASCLSRRADLMGNTGNPKSLIL